MPRAGAPSCADVPVAEPIQPTATTKAPPDAAPVRPNAEARSFPGCLCGCTSDEVTRWQALRPSTAPSPVSCLLAPVVLPARTRLLPLPIFPIQHIDSEGRGGPGVASNFEKKKLDIVRNS